MSEQTEVNNELGAVDIVGKIDDNQRASAIDAIHGYVVFQSFRSNGRLQKGGSKYIL